MSKNLSLALKTVNGRGGILAKLPVFQTTDKNIQLLQNSWSSVLNPALQKEVLNSLVLKNIQLVSGNNTVNHLLGRTLQGWTLVRQRGSATVYDVQDTNPRPELTLILNASTSVSVDILVF